MTDLTLLSKPLLILGDFNIKINRSDTNTLTFIDILKLFNLTQYVNIPTINPSKNTLDLIISSLPIHNISSNDPTSVISDHLLIDFKFALPTKLKIDNRITVTSRPISKINLNSLHADIKNALPGLSDLPDCPNTITDKLFCTLNKITDIHAPLKTFLVTPHPNTQWYNEDCRVSVRIKRASQRLKNKSKKLNRDTYDFYNSEVKTKTKHYVQTLKNAKQSFTSSLTNNNPQKIFKEVKSLYLPKNIQPDTILTCNDFSNYFHDKIIKIRETIPSTTFDLDLTPEQIPKPLNILAPTNESELTNVIKSSKKTNSPLEIFPSKFYIDFLPTLLPYIVKLINSSFSTGVFPSTFKHAVVRPILKKANADPNVPSNYRPISLLPFLSKITEKIAASRLLQHMDNINLKDTYQSGFKSHHSTETSLLYLTDQLLMTSDTGNVSILINLDLSSAFDTLDHETLLKDLNTYLGVTDTALDWFRSYISDRIQTIKIDKDESSPKNVRFGVPQGSVDAPHLFRIYLIPLLILLHKLSLKFSIFADDSSIYISCHPTNFKDTVETITNYYKIISEFISSKFLKLNHSKTQVILIGSENNVSKCKAVVPNLKLSDATVPFSPFVTNLGVEFDETLSFKKHISTVSKNLMFHLRNLRHIRAYFTKSSFETIVHAFITSRLDYCNSLYSGLPSSTLRPLQIAQNFAARIILQRSKFCHITPVLKKLHWLPVESRIKFKIMLFTYKSINHLAPSYLSDILPTQKHSRSLRSSSSNNLIIPRTFKVKMGDRAFSVSAPKLWQNLPPVIKDSTSLPIFKNKLKTYLFTAYFGNN